MMDDAERDELKLHVLNKLHEHQGPDNCVTMEELLIAATGLTIIPRYRHNQTRLIRSMVSDLRLEGHAIGHKRCKGGGYFIATCDEELESTINSFHNSAMSSLRQEAALRRTTPSALMTQCKLEFEEEEKSENGQA